MTPAKIVAGMMSLLMVFAMTRIPVPEKSIVINEVKAQDKFDEAWIDTMKPLVLKSADMEKHVSTDPRPIQTERILTEPVAAPPPIPPVIMVDEVRPSRKRHEHSDVCVRHGMHKVTIGRRWRCHR